MLSKKRRGQGQLIVRDRVGGHHLKGKVQEFSPKGNPPLGHQLLSRKHPYHLEYNQGLRQVYS